MSVTTWGRGQHADASRDDALDGLSGLRVLDKGCIFDALLDLIAFGLRAFFRGNGFVNVSGHAEVMSERRSVTRKFLADRGDSSGVHLQRRRLSLHKVFVRSVCYLGPEGTFSHILARKRFGRRAILAACPTIEAIFDRVLASAEDLGIVPIENSSGGTVYDSVDLLIRHAGHVFIHEELALDVRIALAGSSGENDHDGLFALCADQASCGVVEGAASASAPARRGQHSLGRTESSCKQPGGGAGLSRRG